MAIYRGGVGIWGTWASMIAVRDDHVLPPSVVRTKVAAAPAATATVGVTTFPTPTDTQYKSFVVPTDAERAQDPRSTAAVGAGFPADVPPNGPVATA